MKVRIPQHAPVRQFPIVDDQLVIGGHPITKLAEKVGSTPFYAYDRQAITDRVQSLRALLPDGVELHYAIKANPMPDVVKHLAELVDGMDVASLGELKLALQGGANPAHISFAGPSKKDAELIAAIENEITVNVESPGELKRINRLGAELGIRPLVAIRVNPDFELKSSGMKMGGGPKPFGIDAEKVPQVLRQISKLDVHFRGFQIFGGSQNLKADSLMEAHIACFELANKLIDATPLSVETLNVGGGFGIPYFPGEEPLDVSPVTENLSRLVQRWRQRFPKCSVVLELGRYLVGEAGIYICKVIDRKVSRGTTYLVTDGGLHHHLSASGNLGQLIRKNYPVINPTKVFGGTREKVSVVGPLCTPLDILAERIELGESYPGDLIAVLQSGAYGYSASPIHFLSHPEAIEVIV